MNTELPDDFIHATIKPGYEADCILCDILPIFKDGDIVCVGMKSLGGLTIQHSSQLGNVVFATKPPLNQYIKMKFIEIMSNTDTASHIVTFNIVGPSTYNAAQSVDEIEHSVEAIGGKFISFAMYRYVDGFFFYKLTVDDTGIEDYNAYQVKEICEPLMGDCVVCIAQE